MRVKPVAGGAVTGGEPDVAVIDALHLFDDDALHALEFVRDDIKVKFVVHLQDHLGLDALVLETFVDAHHGKFDDVGRSTLNGRVDGIALGAEHVPTED